MTSFMRWVDLLPEVGDPLRRDRDRILGDAEQARSLELHALALRRKVREGQDELLKRALKRWTLLEIESASSRAEALDVARQLAPASAPNASDDRMQRALSRLDGLHLAAEAISAFRRGGVIRQHNLMSTASEADRLATLNRLLDWWNLAARPVFERLRGDDETCDVPAPESSCPDAVEVLHDETTSRWLKTALRAALDTDPIDAAADAALLARVLQARAAA